MGMAELIDKWEVVNKLIRLENQYNFYKKEWDADVLYRRIVELEIGIGKTTGLEVVRCKDCKHWQPSGSWAGNSEDDLQPIGGCEWAKLCRKANDFCSYGERREGE